MSAVRTTSRGPALPEDLAFDELVRLESGFPFFHVLTTRLSSVEVTPVSRGANLVKKFLDLYSGIVIASDGDEQTVLGYALDETTDRSTGFEIID